MKKLVSITVATCVATFCSFFQIFKLLFLPLSLYLSNQVYTIDFGRR